MAIQFARIEIVSRSSGGNACCKGAYNARAIIRDQRTNIIYNFQRRGDNVYHEILLADGIDQKFKDTKVLMNEVERTEKRKDSQLLKEILLALPDDKELNLQDRIEITKRLIVKREWVKERLAVQIDIHKPHNGEKNWHAHILITTRRFTEDGLSLGAKAVDLNPEFKKAGNKAYVIPEEQQIHEQLKEITNDYFKERGLENRVDAISSIPQEHIGPIRMRSIFNEAVMRNQERAIANLEALKDGENVLDRISKHNSVFNKKDLVRVVKCVTNEARAKWLVAEALQSERIIPLYYQNGERTELYSTKEIRAEELKLLRLSDYIGKQKNLTAQQGVSKLIKASSELSREQAEALSHLLNSDGGIRILKGRAGTGKSRVLGKIADIAKICQIEVMAVTPTHKAKLELSANGYQKCETIKGFLFKLYNNKIDLTKNSLIVVDEAGMVGNDDYLELLRVVTAHKGNLILSGDERQLSSVQRGGMFEIFADKFGYFELADIKRQKLGWGREVAISLSQGRVAEAVDRLVANNRLIGKINKEESVKSLLDDWHSSAFAIDQRLIISVKNADVEIINMVVREGLKARGVLNGAEYAVGSATDKSLAEGEFSKKAISFMEEDRIIFKESNKEMGVSNGDFGKLTKVSKDLFVVMLDSGQEVQFDPHKFSKFRHGYATTAYQAQGASIKDVYVLHGGFSTVQNSYVAMSRHIEDLHLYINNEVTRNQAQLIKQLSLNLDLGASINYLTEEDIKSQEKKSNEGVLGKINNSIDFIKERLTALVDRHKINQDYYQFEKAEVAEAQVEEVLDLIAKTQLINFQANNDNNRESIETENIEELEEKLVVGGENVKSRQNIGVINGQIEDRISKENIDNFSSKSLGLKEKKTAMTGKERFYANREYQLNKVAEKIDWSEENYKLRQAVKWNAEQIAKDLLGEANRHLSNGSTLRFGGSGGVVVKIRGEKCGTWYDFKAGKGGDLFDLVQEKHNCDFKQAANYLENRLGMQRLTNIRVASDHQAKDSYVKHYQQQNQQKAEEVNKVKRVENLYARAKPIEQTSVAYKYLAKREIKGDLTIDIKTVNIMEQSLAKSLPALIVFARDNEGKITGGQHIVLDHKLYGKADVLVAKKSFGKIAGSFVTVADEEVISNVKDGITEKVTIIAEGIETALSIKEAELPISAKILCSLGIGNIKNYQPQANERVIIAGDNDGANAVTLKAIITAKAELENKGAVVDIVTPPNEGDFNDILQVNGNIAGKAEIQKIFAPVLNILTAKTVTEYLTHANRSNREVEQISQDLAIIKKYNMSEQRLVAQFKLNHDLGAEELHNMIESIESAERMVYQNYPKTFDDIKFFGGEIDQHDLATTLNNLPRKERLGHINKIRTNIMDVYVKDHGQKFEQAKEACQTKEEILAIINQEQKFFRGLSGNHPEAMSYYGAYNHFVGTATRTANEKPYLLGELGELIKKVKEKGIMTESEMMTILKSSLDVATIFKSIDKIWEADYIKTNLQSFTADKDQANNPEEILKIIEQEQQFLSSLDGKVKYHSDQESLQISIKQAKDQQQDNIIYHLDKIVRQVVNNGVKKEEQITSELKTSPNIVATLENLERDYEEHHLKSNLQSFTADKQQAQNPEEILAIIEQRQNWLSGLHNNIKYPEVSYQQSLAGSIDQSYQQQQDQVIDHLKQATLHAINYQIMPESEITERLLANSDLRVVEKDLRQACQEHHIGCINSNLEKIRTEQEVIVDGQKFTSQEEYVKHEIANPPHAFSDTARISRRLRECQQHHLELQKQQELEHSMAMRR